MKVRGEDRISNYLLCITSVVVKNHFVWTRIDFATVRMSLGREDIMINAYRLGKFGKFDVRHNSETYLYNTHKGLTPT